MGSTSKSRATVEPSALFLGIDVGTSGIRTCVIDSYQTIVDFQQQKFDKNQQTSPEHWWQITQQLLSQLKQKNLSPLIKSISIAGTSGTLLALDNNNLLLGEAIMYNQNMPILSTPCLETEDTKIINRFPSLKKALHFKQQYKTKLHNVMHQADWVAFKISGTFGFSDYHNCLKLGYQAEAKQWFCGITKLINKEYLPTVKTPGEQIDCFSHKYFGFKNTIITTGTTDSNAAFIASGIHQFGHAISSLGTTLVLKVFSPTKIESEKHGVYSHKYKNGWIVSGASNCGTGILKTYFSDEEIKQFSTLLQPEKSTTLNYYPLTQVGERFPISDPNKQPMLLPRPKDKHLFFQAILENIAKIEQQGYQLLEQLGAPKIQHIFSAGGGASNVKWQQIRSQYCQVSISKAKQTEASFGTALLALAGYNKQH